MSVNILFYSDRKNSVVNMNIAQDIIFIHLNADLMLVLPAYPNGDYLNTDPD